MNIRRSLVFSYLDRYASLIINIGSSMIIARLLTPEDIGIFSVTMVLLSFVTTVRDMGAGGYLVQERDLTLDRVKAVWAVQLGLGLLLALVVLAASVPVALFYGEARMRAIMMVVALTYAINPFGSLTYAWQIREMRFDALALVRFGATLAGALVSVYCAWVGMGPISLAYGSLAGTVVNALMAVHFRPSWFPWLPGTKEIRRVLAYGSQTTGAAMIQTFGGNAPELMLGKLQSMAVTGFYSRASGLVMMFDRLVLSGISSVAISWFANQSRTNGNIAEPMLKATGHVMAIGWAFCLGVCFLAHPIMRVLYGPQWDGAVDLTRLMAIALGLTLPSAMCIPVLMALGCARQVLHGTAVVTAITVLLVAVGAFQGMMETGFCLIVASGLRSLVWVRYARSAVGFRMADLMRAMGSSALVGIGAGIAPLAVFLVYGARPVELWTPLLLAVAGSLLGLIGAIIVVRHPLLEELTRLKEKLLPAKVAPQPEPPEL